MEVTENVRGSVQLPLYTDTFIRAAHYEGDVT